MCLKFYTGGLKEKLNLIDYEERATMGWYTNYEVEFDGNIDWDDAVVRDSLQSFNVTYLYLRDMELPRIVLCVYSTNPVKNILDIMMRLYSTTMRYRIYKTDQWTPFP